MRDDREFLADVLEAIDNIERYTAKGKEAFIEDELLQVWVIHHIQIIGEAANHLSKALQEKHLHIPWADIVAMRNIVVHQYFGIDLEQVWDTVEIDLPALKIEIEKILDV